MKDTIEVFKNFNLAEIVTMMCSAILCFSEFGWATLVLTVVLWINVFTSSAYRQINDRILKNLLK